MSNNQNHISGNAVEGNRKRLYQVWKGRNKFLCGGRLIFGPDASSLYLTTLLIGGPAITFFIKMFLNITETHSIYGYTVFIFSCILTVCSFSFLFLTSGRNPGIVPRNSKPPDESFHGNTPSMEWVNTATDVKLPRTKAILVNGISMKIKYCDTCLLYRPPRASHCSICNNCVDRFDHHCPWVGQCIGKQNYRYFIFFISSSTILCLHVFAFSLVDILEQDRSLLHVLSHDFISVALVAYCFIAVWFVGGLTVFHTYLMSTNQTTYENFRYRYDKKKNPYNIGMAKNLKEILFSRTPQTTINFREWVIETEDPVLESVTDKFGKAMIGTKNKDDFGIGGSIKKENDVLLPNILQNLDYDGIDDKLKTGSSEDFKFDPFSFPVNQEFENLEHRLDNDSEEKVPDGGSR